MKNLKTFLLIVSLIFLLNVIFFNVSYATLYIIKDQEENFVLLTNSENLVSKYELLGYTIYILKEYKSSQETLTKPQPSPQLKPEPKIESKPKPTANIKIVDWTDYPSETGNYIYVEGVLQNISKVIATSVRLKIQALDKYDKLVSITPCYADPTTLNPNQKATFITMVTSNPKISKFNLTVLWD